MANQCIWYKRNLKIAIDCNMPKDHDILGQEACAPGNRLAVHERHAYMNTYLHIWMYGINMT